MSDETPGEKAEKARLRRRWLTLGELLAIAAVAISALTFWNSWRERTDTEASRTAESAQAARRAETLILQARVEEDGRRLALAPRGDGQIIQGQVLRFPAALGLDPVDTSGDARIERGWFDEALEDARAKGKDGGRAPGDARLPVAVTTTFLVEGEPHVDRAVYQIGYSVERGVFGSRFRLRGLSRVGAVASDAAGQRKVDGLARF